MGPDGQPDEAHPSPSAGPHQPSLTQHYRDHPSLDQDCSSEDDLNEMDHAESEGTAPDDDKDDPSTWLADPPLGELKRAQLTP